MTNVPLIPQLAFIESPMQLLLIFGIAFVLFGAKKMPIMARDLGKGIRIFRKSLSGENDGEEITENRDLVTCTACGTSLMPGNKFCAECGNPLEKTFEIPVENISINPVEEKTSKKEVKMPSARKKIQDDLAFINFDPFPRCLIYFCPALIKVIKLFDIICAMGNPPVIQSIFTR